MKKFIAALTAAAAMVAVVPQASAEVAAVISGPAAEWAHAKAQAHAFAYNPGVTCGFLIKHVGVRTGTSFNKAKAVLFDDSSVKHTAGMLSAQLPKGHSQIQDWLVTATARYANALTIERMAKECHYIKATDKELQGLVAEYAEQPVDPSAKKTYAVEPPAAVVKEPPAQAPTQSDSGSSVFSLFSGLSS